MSDIEPWNWSLNPREDWDAAYEHCPGPHWLRKHHDSNAPWCDVCGRTSDDHLVGGGSSD